MEWSALVAARKAFGPVLYGFTDRAIETLAVARLEANSRHQPHLCAEHILAALACVNRSVARTALERLGVQLVREREKLESALAAIPAAGEGRDVAGDKNTRQLLLGGAQRRPSAAPTSAPST